jgi:lysophospholipase L1-like esterase
MRTAIGVLLAIGCGPEVDPKRPGDAGDGPEGGDTDDTDDPDDTDDSDDPSDTDEPTGPTALVHSVGRFTDDPVPRSSWTLTSHETVLEGDALSVELAGAPDIWYEIVVDGEPVGQLVTTGGDQVYPLVSGLDDGSPHRVGIFRRNEGWMGDVGFAGFVPGPGAALVESPYPYRHLIEYIGDSVTAGYGNEGDGPYCSFTADTENGYATYAAIAARDLDAAAVLVAFSGKGVIQDYNGDRYAPMPVLYGRTLTFSADDSWGFSQYTPDLVVVNLGSNDLFSGVGEEEFVDGYVALLGQIRGVNPDAAILAVSWQGFGDLVQTAVAQSGDPDVHLAEFAYANATGDGCDQHPDLAEHEELGHAFAEQISDLLGW